MFYFCRDKNEMQMRPKHISCLVGLFLISFTALSQGLPSLSVAKEISNGVLPNGIEYYLVTNLHEKGFADFALVRKGECEEEQERTLLDSLPHFGPRKPYQFLSDNGVGYSHNGYITHYPDATLFHFEAIPTHDQMAADSTLMLLFDIAASSRQPQAVIVSGDVQPAQITERMKLLSLLVPRLQPDTLKSSYEWHPSDSLQFRVGVNSSEDVVAINATFSAQRLPLDLMNTPQPLIMKAYANFIGYIVSRRVEGSFRLAGVPLADVRSSYEDSSKSAGDEKYTFTVFTSSKFVAEATRLFALVLSSLDSGGASRAEFDNAKARLVSNAKREEGGRPKSNSSYVAKCASSYLHGSDLASDAVINQFLANRDLSGERELGLFNAFVSALLDSSRNLTLRYDTSDIFIDCDVLLKTFDSAWTEPVEEFSYKEEFSDTLSLNKSRRKVKIRTETVEPTSGAAIWTFTNGIKVLFKKSDLKGEFHYAILMRGGMPLVPGLQSGEGAFVSDMLTISDISGLSGRDFKAMLQTNGISMEEKVGVSDMRIYGTALNTKLPLLMRSLLTLSDKRKPNAGDFEYYKKCETLRLDMKSLSALDVNSLIDSVMRPNYFYTERKYIENLHDDLPQRTEQYFTSQFSKMGDGIFVFIGDLDEDALKKELCRYLGEFKTNGQYAARSKVKESLAVGETSVEVESTPGIDVGGQEGVSVGFTAVIPYNVGNYINFRFALASIRKALIASLSSFGASAQFTEDVEMFPTERLTFFVNCYPCLESGLPLSVTPLEPQDLARVVRETLNNLSALNISSKDVSAYKDALLADFDNSLKDPQMMLEAILARFGEGKDIVKGYKEAIKSVSEDSIRKILEDLESGTRVEYIVK